MTLKYYIFFKVQGRLEQAVRWLTNPSADDKGLGQRAIALIVEEGKKVADGLPGHQKSDILHLCDEVENLANQYSKLCAAGLAHTPEAQEIARKLNSKLHELKNLIQSAVVSRVVEDFIDISTPLKQFTEAVNAPEGTPNREQNFNQKAANLQAFSDRASKTSRMVAAGGSGGNKKLAEVLLASAAQIDSLTPQLISAGRIRMNYPGSKAAEEHYNNLKQQYADTILRMRTLCDQATDPADFVKASEEQMQKHSLLCEDAIRNKLPQKMVDNTSSIARLANRVLLVAKQEADNSEDPMFINELLNASDKLQNSVPNMVQNAKSVATDVGNATAGAHWRDANKQVSLTNYQMINDLNNLFFSFFKMSVMFVMPSLNNRRFLLHQISHNYALNAIIMLRHLLDLHYHAKNFHQLDHHLQKQMMKMKVSLRQCQHQINQFFSLLMDCIKKYVNGHQRITKLLQLPNAWLF